MLNEISADNGSFAMKEHMGHSLRVSLHELVDFGAYQLTPGDDYPNFISLLAPAVSTKKFEYGLALCGTGVGVA
ncbi:RpiB/LacA/LacB family sugar-phosphate isomerase [Allopusillimonas ginsengisoli]|nr:RpiB/LacA/LacB family sugar-phosphate isomerase [Allopusillimonas ginsengisoli]